MPNDDKESKFLKDLERRRLVDQGDGKLSGDNRGKDFGGGLSGNFADLYKEKDGSKSSKKER